jgi:pimeloyl-ACP methyl ester carboxylesterase
MTGIVNLSRFRELVLGDRELAHDLTGLGSAIARLDLPNAPLEVSIKDGKVIDVGVGSRDADLIYEAPAEFWNRLTVNPPPPGYESLTGGSCKGLKIAGDIKTVVAPYHPAWERLFQLLGEAIRGPVVTRVADTEPFRETDNAVGRYTYITVAGVEMRVYYETAGIGSVPLLLQHTAGADARQWRHLLADPDLQRDFTMIAYDLPYHGRSMPPTSIRWWEQSYEISQKQIMATVLAISEKLKLEQPIFMGCSVGGQLALDLAAFHPKRFRAFIALNGWHDMGPMEGFSNDPFRDPTVSANWYASGCYGATSPLAPEALRKETYWIYRSNFPGVYAGDNDYFMHGHDLRRDGHLIDATSAKIYVLTGSYDPSVHFADHGGAAVARKIPGVIYREMAGLSHFAPSDDPLRFREELIPVLTEIIGT